jgi:hypothetical protein
MKTGHILVIEGSESMAEGIFDDFLFAASR